MDKLTPKQEEVIRLMAKGLTNGQIAEHMGISLAGAKWHVGEVLSKYGVNSREQAVRMWKQEQTIGARIGRMAAAIPFPKLVGGGVAVAGIAALAIIAAIIISGGGDGFSHSDITGHEPLTGEPSVSQNAVYYPDHFANTVTRQVMYPEWPEGDAAPENSPRLVEMWAERDGKGYAIVTYMTTVDFDGTVMGVNRRDEDDTARYEVGTAFGFNCIPQAEQFPDLGASGIGPYGHAGLPVFGEPVLLREAGFAPAREVLEPSAPLPPVRTFDIARERFAADFTTLESWSGRVELEPPEGTMTLSYDAEGLMAAGRMDYDEGPSDQSIPNFIIMTEVFDLDAGVELRKQVIPWEEWCPE